MRADNVTMAAQPTGTPADLLVLLELLGRDPDENMSICYLRNGIFRAELIKVQDAATTVAKHADGDCWFGTQVLHARVSGGRGGARDVVAVRDLCADLDIKPGGMPTMAAAEAVIEELSSLLGAQPVAVVRSGHGLQPHWAIERGDATDWSDERDPRHSDAVALWRRVGRLISTVAGRHGGAADSVFDLSRVMRTPGTVNRKDPANPVQVEVCFPGGAPVSLTRIAEACSEWNVVPQPEDRETLETIVAPRGQWQFGLQTCGYLAAVLAGWGTDTPPIRHPWLVSQATRLASAHRLGCLIEADHARALDILTARFRELLGTGEVRAEGDSEIADALAWGTARVETFSEQRTREDLGSAGKPHVHPAQAAGQRPASGQTQAHQLVTLANSRYTFGVDDEGEPFAVPRSGPYWARQLHGGGHNLKAELAAAFLHDMGKVPSAGKLIDAMTVLEGQARNAEPTRLHLRVAPTDSGLLLDLGHADGTVVEVTDRGWGTYQPTDGPLFRRTKLTAALPAPAACGDLEPLWRLLNVTERDQPLLLGWLVAALLPDIPHPIALLTGEQGTGKTTAGRLLISLIDPSAAPLRTGPRDEHGWGVAAAASWLVGIDNLSSISPWLSDAMCRAVTGEGVVSRALYTNADVHLLAFRRVLLLTSIDPGALRGDLAERLVSIDLERIRPDCRRTDQELAAEFDRAHPAILAGLLELTAQVLAALPQVRGNLPGLPRMADFAEVLAALDVVRGTDSLGDYLRGAERVSRDVLDNDPVGAAVGALLALRSSWRGSYALLLDELTRLRPVSAIGRAWPATSNQLAARLRSMAPALRANGIGVEVKRSNGDRSVWLWRESENRP